MIIKAIPNATGYFITDAGRVFSTKSGKQKEISPWKTPKGYLRVEIKVGGIRRQYFVHRLVLTVFVGPCPLGQEGSHLNGIKHDNTLSNLAWETGQQNNQRKLQHGTHQYGSMCNWAILTENHVVEIKAAIKEGVKIGELAQKYGVAYNTICNIKHGTRWTHV